MPRATRRSERGWSLFSYTNYSNCYGGSACITFPSPARLSDSAWPALRRATEGRGADQPKRPLRLELPDDLLSHSGSGLYSIPRPPDGTIFQPPSRPAGRRQAMTSDGTALPLNRQTGSLALWTPESGATYPLSRRPNPALSMTSAPGLSMRPPLVRKLICELLRSPRAAMFCWPAGRWNSGSTPVFDASISYDDATVLYVAAPESGQPSQIWTIRLDGTGRRQLTTFPQDRLRGHPVGQRPDRHRRDRRPPGLDRHRYCCRSRTDPSDPNLLYGLQSLAPGSLFPLMGTVSPLRPERHHLVAH